jgi:hypothetical protein
MEDSSQPAGSVRESRIHIQSKSINQERATKRARIFIGAAAGFRGLVRILVVVVFGFWLF